MESTQTNPYASPASDETQEKIIFSSGELATLGERLGAALIDGLIALPISLGFGIALGMGLLSSGVAPDTVMFQVFFAIAGLGFGGALFCLLHGYLLATRGQTIGKWFLKTQIVSDDGEQLSLGRLILHRYLPIWLVSVVPVVGNWLVLADAAAIFRSERKCIHDEIAGTKVIKLH
jgi:uncharacterized RDD family membrane protein YckC